ncbi:MAG: DUF447 family protein [Methanolinea sp.]|nr:DUF447 family protein [Methanolinea sp.]
MGLLGEGINEVIATTRDNAAPMGIILRGGRYSMVVYRGSHTHDNLGRHRWIVANIVHDPVLYVRTAFSDPQPGELCEEKAGDTVVQRLRAAEAWVAFRVSEARETADALVAVLEPMREEVVTPRVHPVNRGFSSVIEATIHATRYVRQKDEEIARLIVHHAGIVHKCGGPREEEALSLLRHYLLEKTGFPVP